MFSACIINYKVSTYMNLREVNMSLQGLETCLKSHFVINIRLRRKTYEEIL